MSQRETLKREHDYLLNYLSLVDYKGNEYDFTSHYVEFTYEESIFSGTHGNLVALDAIDYPTLLPIIGEERIKASFTRPDETKDDILLPALKFDMGVYQMSGKVQAQGSKKSQVYTLKYITDAAFKSINARVSKAYKATKYSDMVQALYDEFLDLGKPIEIEPTLYEVDYTICNTRPFDAIAQICKRSISEENNGSLYCFYEDRDSFYFMTIGKMFDRPISHTIRYEPKNIDIETGGIEHKPADAARGVYNVSHIQHGQGFDVLASAIGGEGASSLISINPIRRKMITTDFDLKSEFEQFKHLEKNKPWTEQNKMFVNPKANPLLIVSNIGNDTAPYIAEREPNIKPFFYEEYKLHRISQKSQIFRHTITASFSGDPRIKAGQIIEFLLPEHLGKTSEANPEELDRYLQGKYLVASVGHVLKQDQYTVNVELLKDSYFKEIQNRDPIREYDPIY